MKYVILKNKHFENTYRDFLKSYVVSGYSNIYIVFRIRELLSFLEKRGIKKLKNVRALDIITYVEYLKKRPNKRTHGSLSNSTIRTQISIIRLFFDYLIKIGTLSSSPVCLTSSISSVRKEKNILTIGEIMELYGICKNRYEKALLGLAYGCGLRRSEITDLNVNDIQFNKSLIEVSGKYGKTRTIPVTKSVLNDLKEYIIYERSKHRKHSSAYFMDKATDRMPDHRHYNRIKYLVKRTKNKILIQKNITLHSFRHSIATHMLDNGATMEFVRLFLGHSHLDTTHLYCKQRMQKLLIQKQT